MTKIADQTLTAAVAKYARDSYEAARTELEREIRLRDAVAVRIADAILDDEIAVGAARYGELAALYRTRREDVAAYQRKEDRCGVILSELRERCEDELADALVENERIGREYALAPRGENADVETLFALAKSARAAEDAVERLRAAAVELDVERSAEALAEQRSDFDAD